MQLDISRNSFTRVLFVVINCKAPRTQRYDDRRLVWFLECIVLQNQNSDILLLNLRLR